MSIPKNYELHLHYKGKFYLLRGKCIDTENENMMMYYQAIYGEHQHFCRPIRSFYGFVDVEPRFELYMKLSPLLKKCLLMASIAHKGQTRKGGDIPYINHPIRVAKRISTLYPDFHQAIAAAFLHDTIEDTNLTYQQIVEKVGVEIADIVLEVTDDQTISKRQQKENQIINASHKSIFSKLVKTADKIDNCTDFIKENPDNLIPIMCFSKKVVDGMRCPEIELLVAQFDRLYNNVVPSTMSSEEFEENVTKYLDGKSSVSESEQ